MKKKLMSLFLAAAMTVGAGAYSLSLGAGIADTVSAAGSVDLWFDHVTVKTDQKDTASSGMYTYHMYMAKNEIENCQFFLSPSENMSLTVEVSDFVGDKGAVLETELYFEHYFHMRGDDPMPDAIPPVTGAIDVDGGESQGFIVKTKTTVDSAAGDYTATVTVKNGDEVVKTAEITLTVWNFELTEETPLATAVDISRAYIYNYHESNDEALYKAYYDFMLENRVSAYHLPYDILDDAADEYMSNPRVTSFQIGGDYSGNNTDDDSIKAIYEKLSTNSEWADKGYFYYVDEPSEMTKLNQLKAAGEKLETLYPGYQMISPYFVNIDMGDGTDQFTFMSKYIKLWCTKVNAWTPVDTTVEGAIHMMSEDQVKKYGDFASRMATEVEGGDKNWVYYCWEPLGPYTTFDASHQTIEQRVAMWQAMDNDVTGFLYFTATEWTSGMWRTIDKINAGGERVYGDGILLYPGAKYNVEGPISSLRFESLRDGIEDYMYLDMAKGLIDEELYEMLMDFITVSVVYWTDDSDLFYETRVTLGNLIESAVNNDGRAEGVVFKESTGYTANTNTGYIGGVDPQTTVITILSSLENMNGIQIMREGTALEYTDTVKSGDSVVLTAEDGTVKASFTVVIMGDVNSDGNITISDATDMLKRIANWDNITLNEVAADVDGDGKIAIADVMLLLKVIAKWDVSFVTVPVIPGTVDIEKSTVLMTYSSADGHTALNLRSGKEVGVKFTVGEGEYARAIISSYPSWDDNYGELTLSLYKWNTDYDTTIAAMPIYSNRYDGFEDNEEIIFEITDSAGKGVGEGEYLWLIHKGYDDYPGTSGNGVGVWTSEAPAADSGIVVYCNGVVQSYGIEATINIGTAK